MTAVYIDVITKSRGRSTEHEQLVQLTPVSLSSQEENEAYDEGIDQ